ncbi:hypothetical protein pEaSNUABM37_00278 [Erwinia phage pEa_SNUABM_37]|nr:hypothetical protein pEaSNUABM37_00278 [Erwinia phage pEa_SNUABM_37]QXO10746.1 hypothetical protein pEaSNUABM48_00278 [Erwinia phage pEa_SNUABM_48]
MHLSYTSKPSTTDIYLANILVNHNGEVITFNQDAFFKSAQKDHNGTFDELNGYIAAYLNQDQQAHMFSVYKRIRYVLDTEQPTPKVLLPLLQPLVKELYSLVNINDVNLYMYNNKLTHVPAAIPDVISQTKEYSNATTYVKADYVRLVNLAVLYHLMAPVIADYVNAVSEVTGKQFKESAALALFQYADIMYSEEMVKLKRYVEAHCEKKPVPLSATLAGLSEENFPNWMLASVIARRLCINHVRRGDDSGHLVAQVYMHIQFNIKLDGKFGGGVMAKSGRHVAGDDEQEKPVIESWKTKQEIYETDIIICEDGFRDIYFAASFCCPDVPKATLDACIKAIPTSWDFEMTDHQAMLMQWVGAKFVSPNAVPYFGYTTDMALLAITQAALWHRGFVQLAAIAGTYRTDVRSEELPVPQLALTQNIKMELEKMYNIQLDKRQGTNDGLVHRTLELFTNSVMIGTYKVVGPDQLLADSQVVDYDRYLVVPNNLNFLLADLIRHVAQEGQIATTN